MTLRTFLATLLLSIVWSTAGAQSLPNGWSTRDIGAVGATGSASGSGGSFTMDGAGADVWGTADAFRFAYISLTGDGTIVARVTSVDAVNAWTKAGVMMRESLAADARQVFMLVSPGKGLAFQRRVTAGHDSTHTGATGTAPAWVRLTRVGNVFTAYRSADGSSWTQVDVETIAMASTIHVGLAVSSHVTGVLATAAFDSVGVSTPEAPESVGASGSLPTGWSSSDIGAVGRAGIASGSGGSFSVSGAGADVWGTADALRFAYTQLTGDGSIVTRVESEQALNAWTKAGVMMRDTLATNSRQAFMLVSPGKGLAFQRRPVAGGDSVNTSGGGGTAPSYVKLTRSGNTFTAYRSSDGGNWTTVGSQSISMGSTIYVGLAVSSHVAGVLANATFSSTAVTAGAAVAAPAPPPSGSTTTFRLLHWNTHHGGVRSDGVYDPGLIASWIAQINPEVVSLNEVDNVDQVNAIVSRLNALTGRTWTTMFGGAGNLLLSRVAVDVKTNCTYNASYPRVAPHMTVTLNGRPVNVFSAHLAVDSASTRLAEVKALQACATNFAEARILAGDFNMQEGSTEYNQAIVGYNDAWKLAKSLGTAINFSGNCDGCTRNSRIDYVFASKGASFLELQSAEVLDTRNSGGVTPSDHKPMVVVYKLN